MPLTIVPIQPGILIGAAARAGNTGNFTALNYVYGVAWRCTTSLLNDYKVVPTTAFGEGAGPLQKPWGYARGVGRRIQGILFTGDPNACEALVENSDMIVATDIISMGSIAPDVATALQLRIKFKITKSGSNVACQKTFAPVAFGTYPGMDEKEWCRTLMFADGGRRDATMFPWQVQMSAWQDSLANHVVTVYSTNTNLYLG